jgi:hypothetical protein
MMVSSPTAKHSYELMTIVSFSTKHKGIFMDTVEYAVDVTVESILHGLSL